jgi:hypothetical protein
LSNVCCSAWAVDISNVQLLAHVLALYISTKPAPLLHHIMALCSHEALQSSKKDFDELQETLIEPLNKVCIITQEHSLCLDSILGLN